MEGSVQGGHVQLGEGDLNRILRRIEAAEQFEQVFPGVSALRLQADGSGAAISLRITKVEGASTTPSARRWPRGECK